MILYRLKISLDVEKENETKYFPNTKVRTFHLELSGQTKQIQYQFLA
ncbi:MAG: hypothetical protein ACQER7_09940 [Bacteroidota bacterium]